MVNENEQEKRRLLRVIYAGLLIGEDPYPPDNSTSADLTPKTRLHRVHTHAHAYGKAASDIDKQNALREITNVFTEVDHRFPMIFTPPDIETLVIGLSAIVTNHANINAAPYTVSLSEAERNY